MVAVRFPKYLISQFTVPEQTEAEGETVAEVLQDLERKYPGVCSYLLHENGTMRQHINIFLDEAFIRDREKLSDGVGEIEELVIMQALSGG